MNHKSKHMLAFERTLIIIAALTLFAFAVLFGSPVKGQTLVLTAKMQDGGAYIAKLDADKFAPTVPPWSMFVGTKGRVLGAHLLDWRWPAKDLALGAVQVSNGAANSDGTGHCGEVFFASMSLAVDGWRVVWLAEPLPASADSMPSGYASVHRFALYRGKTTARDAWAALDSVPAFDRTKPFGPLQLMLPTIDVDAQEKKFAPLVTQLRSALLLGRRFDPAGMIGTLGMPGGDYYTGAPGGTGITFCSGWQSAPSAARWFRYLTDAWVKRQRVHVYDIASGRRLTTDDWSAKSGTQPFWTFLHGMPNHVDQYAPRQFGPRRTWSPPCFDVPAWNSGVAPKRAERERYQPENAEHWIRPLDVACASFWLSGDPVARWLILDMAQWARTSYSDHGNLRAQRDAKRKNPGNGSQGRAFGEAVLYQGAAALAVLAPNDPERPGVERWVDMGLDLYTLCAMPSGATQRAVSDKNPKPLLGVFDAPSMWTGFGMPQGEDCARTFEKMIADIGALAAMRQREMLPGQARAPVRNSTLAVIKRSAENLFANPQLQPRGYEWDGKAWKQFGPPNSVAVAPYGKQAYTTLTLGSQAGDPAHCEILLAELWRATGEDRWRDALLRYGYTAPSLAEKRAAMAKRIANPDLGFQPEWIVPAAGALEHAMKSKAVEAGAKQ